MALVEGWAVRVGVKNAVYWCHTGRELEELRLTQSVHWFSVCGRLGAGGGGEGEGTNVHV